MPAAAVITGCGVIRTTGFKGCVGWWVPVEHPTNGELPLIHPSWIRWGAECVMVVKYLDDVEHLLRRQPHTGIDTERKRGDQTDFLPGSPRPKRCSLILAILSGLCKSIKWTTRGVMIARLKLKGIDGVRTLWRCGSIHGTRGTHPG